MASYPMMASVASAEVSFDDTLHVPQATEQTGSSASAPLTPVDLNLDHIHVRTWPGNKSDVVGVLLRDSDESHDTENSVTLVKELGLAASTPVNESQLSNDVVEEYMHRDDDVSTQDREAMEAAFQELQDRPRRSNARKNTNYAPNCSPGGTEKKPKQKSRKTKPSNEDSQASSSSHVKKRQKTNSQEDPQIISDDEKIIERKSNKKKKSMGTSEDQTAMIIIDDEEGKQVVRADRKVAKDRKAPSSKESKKSETNAKSSRRSQSQSDSQKKDINAPRKESDIPQEDDDDEYGADNPKRSQRSKKAIIEETQTESDKEDEAVEKKIERTNQKPEQIHKKGKLSSLQSESQKSKISKVPNGITTHEEIKKKSLLSGSMHGKSLGSLLSSSPFGGARHPGLVKKRGVPTLHLNRIKEAKARKQEKIKLEEKKKKKGQDGGNNYDSDDETGGNQFQRRKGETEAQYLVRILDEEGSLQYPSQTSNGKEEQYSEWKEQENADGDHGYHDED